MCTFLESALSPAMSPRNKVAWLNLMNNVHKFRFDKDAEINFMKEKIREFISSPLTRLEGYLYLDALLTNNPKAYIPNWGPIITSSLKCPDNYVSKQLTLRILTLVVVNFSADPSCADQFHRFIPEILCFLLKVEENDQDLVYFCRALAICMQYIPAILGPHSDEIELFLMKHMNSPSHDVIEAISDCFAAYPVCLGNFQRPKPFFMDTWLAVNLKILNTLQALFNDILLFLEVENSLVNVDDLDLFNLPFDPDEEAFSYVSTRITIFSNLCKCLAKMMSACFEFNSENTRVQVPVNDLLKCLERVFQVEEIMKVKKSPKQSAFVYAYPLLQNAVFVVLRALIINFPILEQSGNFAKLLNESISATKSADMNTSSSWQVRSTTWKTLHLWLKQYGAKGSYEIANDSTLIQELLTDIAADPTVTTTTTSLKVDTFREECCLEALQVVQNIFTTGGSYMDKRLVDEISNTLFKTSMKIQLYMHPAKKFPYPYTNENCRLILYESLFSASLFADPLQAKYINPAINIFKIALKDPYMEIILLCHRAFKIYRYIINPKKPPPEALTYLNVGRALPPPPQENVLAGWENGNWNINNESSQEERSMEIAPPCQIETVFHNSIKSDGQRDLIPVQNAKSPIHYSEAHGSQSQCNGNNSRLVSNKPPSHSNICNDSGSEVEEYKEYNLEDTHLILPVDIPPIAQTPIIKSIDPQVCEPKPTNIEPKIIELRPLEPAIPEKIATTNHRNSSAADAPINCIDDVEVEEEIPIGHRRMAENGMDVESEDEESGDEDDEEGTGSDEDEEVNETYHPEDGYSPEFYHHEQEVSISERCSPEYYRERPIKRRKISNEEEHSSEEYEEEKSSNQNQEMNPDEESEEEEEEEMEMANRSPTVSEMCQDFVLAEPEEIS